MRKRRILVIEDDPAIRQGLVDALEFAGYAVSEAGEGPAGLELAIKTDASLVLLDLVLPGGLDGLDILREVRSVRPTLPVIVLTARGQEPERVQGLRLGADDYVVKPFSVKELLARIEAVLRRSSERPLDIQTIETPQGTIDFERSEMRFTDGGSQVLTAREIEILRYLACNAGRAITREELLARVWRINPRAIIETRTIDMHIARLREKLRDDPGHARVIVTVKGRGYMLATAESAAEPESNAECGMRNAEKDDRATGRQGDRAIVPKSPSPQVSQSLIPQSEIRNPQLPREVRD